MSETLGSFPRIRRDRTDPDSIGLDLAGSGRRVPELRRDELARLAGISVSYHMRIEQDRVGTASGQVFETLASVIRLNTAGRIHLYNLAGTPTSSPTSRELPEVPHPRVPALFEPLSEAIPTVVLGRRGDILAWNRSGHELLFGHLPFGTPSEAHQRLSVLYLFFVGPASRDLYRNQEDLARVHVAYFRLTSGRYSRDARLVELIGKLLVKSTRFAGLWAEGDVADYTVGNTLLAHPGLGHVDIDYQAWQRPESPDHRLEVYTSNDRLSREALGPLKNGRFPSRAAGICERATP